MSIFLIAVTLFVLSTQLGLSEEHHALVGNWRLVSYRLIVENSEPQPVLGMNPKGFLMFTPEGRMSAILAAEDRKVGPSAAEEAALLKSMIAYSGKYRIEGGDFVTKVDISWNEEWTGTEQRRHFRFDGERLMITSAPQKSTIYGGKTIYAQLVWEKEK